MNVCATVLMTFTAIVSISTKRFFAFAWGGRQSSVMNLSAHNLSRIRRMHRATPTTTAPTVRVKRWCCSAYGQGMDQYAMMETDELIAVDANDQVIADVHRILSKKKGHSFNAQTPRGTLHRAFSFFLFDENGRLLLTQRAPTKLTFPGVWTNTACSHPLHNMAVSEVDDSNHAYPMYPGIKHAAVRKLQHELGIHPSQIDLGRIMFVKRFHYWAADTISYDLSTPWGEHEIDYILFYQIDNVNSFKIRPNPDEVKQFDFVSLLELRNRMKSPNHRWSPWFRGIMDRGGWEWWENLASCLSGTYTSRDIVFFDPPMEHVAMYNHPSHDRLTGVWKMESDPVLKSR